MDDRKNWTSVLIAPTCTRKEGGRNLWKDERMQHLDFPNNIQIETTSRCNAKCGFCPYPTTSKEQPQGEMDEDVFQSIVEQISQYPVDLIQPFLNNDPLMDKRILSRLQLLISKNPRARVSITTNGLLLQQELCRELAQLKLDTIHISSNGLTSEVNRKTMGIDGNTVLRNVNRLWDEMQKAGSQAKLTISAILLKTNKHEVVHMREYWKSRGVNFYLNPLNDRAGNIGDDTFFELLPFGEDVNQSQLRHINMSGCPALYGFMGILWNGDIVRCCQDWRRSRVLGNARDESLYNIWHGKHYSHLRNLSNTGRLEEEEICRNCGDQKWGMDSQTLHTILTKQSSSESVADKGILIQLESLRRETPDMMQLGVFRD